MDNKQWLVNKFEEYLELHKIIESTKAKHVKSFVEFCCEEYPTKAQIVWNKWQESK